jgi:tetratricopeptide (TPR) repeat protein
MRLPASSALLLPAVLALAVACSPGGSSAPAGQATATDAAADALAKGIAAHNAGKPEEAKKYYFTVLANDPKNKFAYYNLGQIARLSDRFPVAEGYYRSALEIDPNYGPALFGLGAVRQALNFLPEAIDFYRKDIAVEPNNAAAHYNLGILLRITGKVAEGEAEIAKGIQLDPKLPAPGPVVTPKPTPTR